VVPAPGNQGPRYPEILKSANVEGEVLAQFVVDTSGRVEIGTFKVLKSSHELFTQAVKTSLQSAKYLPAEVGGRRVKQLVQQPFQFQLTK
jgi:protein TonB